MGIVLSELEESFLADFEKLGFDHMRVVVRFCVPAEGVAEDKGDEDEVEEGEGVECEVGEEGETHHLQEGFLGRFGALAEQTRA